MRIRFRDKLLLAFALLLLGTMVPVLVLVNRQIETISERKIDQDLRTTGRVLGRFQTGRLAEYSEKTTNFILTQPEIRAEIATVRGAEALFGTVFQRGGQPAPEAPSGGDPFGAAPAAPAGGGDPFGAVQAQPGQTTQGAPAGDPFGAVTAPEGAVTSSAAAKPGRAAQDAPCGLTPPPGGGCPSPDSERSGSGPEGPADGVGRQPPTAPAPHGELPERQNLILSIVEEVGLYRDSAVFFLTDFRGHVIFTKSDPARVDLDVSTLPVARAALAGNEVFTWWGSREADPIVRALLPADGADPSRPGDAAPRLYQTFLKPVVFGGEVKGLIGIGFPFTAAELADVIGITQADVAFVAGGHVYVSSRPGMPARALLAVAEEAPDAARAQGGPPADSAQPPANGRSDGEGDGNGSGNGDAAATRDGGDGGGGGGGDAAKEGREPVQRFQAGDETWLALRVPVQNTLGEPVGAVVVYRSKTREQAVFNRLRTILNGIGLVALAAAAVLAFALSHSVAAVVRQLFRGVRAVQGGDLDVRLDIRSRDEFGELGRAFNEMTAGLKEKEQIRSTFRRYVSSTVVDELLRSADSIRLGGERKALTIQFSDIAGFTALSESLPPEGVVEFLNTYLSRMTGEVEAEQGIVDKYIGDAVMAFWGAPVPQPDHADRACRAALRQLREVAALRAGWAGRGDLSRFDVRLGLHSGEVIVGNIGSDTRMDYTIIGDAVNIASRLEGTNKVYGTHILLSEDTLALLKGRYVTRELDRIAVVGRTAPIRIHELAGEEGEVPDDARALHTAFAEGLADYRARRFEAAARRFAEAAQAGDAPARTFLARCEDFLRTPPPDDWDGVYRSTSK